MSLIRYAFNAHHHAVWLSCAMGERNLTSQFFFLLQNNNGMDPKPKLITKF